MHNSDDPRPLPVEPDIWQNMRSELVHGSRWWNRAIVLAYALLAGLSVVVFTWLTDIGFAWFRGLYTASPWLVLLWTPLCTMLVVAITRRCFAGAAGSGIPQVMVAIEPQLPSALRSRFASLWLSAGKVLLASAGLAGGLSVRHEVARYSDNLALVAIGMTSFLAAVTQAPLTAFIIVMVDGGAMVMSLMLAAMLASMLSRMISRPLYPALASAMYEAVMPPPPSTSSQHP